MNMSPKLACADKMDVLTHLCALLLGVLISQTYAQLLIKLQSAWVALGRLIPESFVFSLSIFYTKSGLETHIELLNR